MLTCYIVEVGTKLVATWNNFNIIEQQFFLKIFIYVNIIIMSLHIIFVYNNKVGNFKNDWNFYHNPRPITFRKVPFIYSGALWF